MNIKSTLSIASLVTAGWSLMAEQPDLSKLPAPAKKTGITYEQEQGELVGPGCCTIR
jgi:hypothetical protein